MIAVVGAGPAGLAAASMLQRAGEEVTLLERAQIGAAWTTRYDRLHLHTVRWLSGLPGYGMPRAYGKWPPADRVLEYLRTYAVRHDLDVRTNVEVTRVERRDGGWTVTTRDGSVFAARVVMATGHNSVPFMPVWQGELAGTIVHSADYRNPASYVGKRVLVVGAGNSGAEIAVDLADGGAAGVLIAVRSSPHIVRRDTLGVPSQLLGIATPHLPVPAVDALARSVRRISIPDLTAYGLPASASPYSDFLRRHVIPIVDVGFVDAVRKGRVRIVGPLEGFEDGKAVVSGGGRADVDAVIAATGYRPGLEPLVGHLGVLDDRGEPVVHGADEHPGAQGLHFVGYRVTLGGTFRLTGIEARQLARKVTLDGHAAGSNAPSNVVR